ncbi:MAG TPA: T9SS type A sorting domain-containing protein [Flavobacteriales bacterium]|nr:T9SS type A sorting domain-containing protein [Flavobacteriales bacterium]
MRIPKPSILAVLTVTLALDLRGQDFINGDLEGPPATQLTMLPPNWQAVPDNDPVCVATNNSLGDTPDLTDMNGPSVFTGLYGNPYSGSSFVTGGRSADMVIFQEGIMQQVSGFVPGNTYTIVLHQAVARTYGTFDTTGCWAVYIGNGLAGITAPTTSHVPYNEAPFEWEQRMITFVASSTSHTIKFLPYDDDPELATSTVPTNEGGALTMGIDLVSILPGFHTTSIADAKMPTDRILAPNPVNDDLMIEVLSAYSSGTVRIHSATGVLIHEQGLMRGHQRTTIALAAVQPGIYIVSIVLDGIESRHHVVKE